MQHFKSHQSISSVLLLNSVSSESTTVTVNNSTQPLCVTFLLSTVTNGLISSYIIRNVDVMLQRLRMVNGSREYVHVKRFVLHTTSSVVNTCADALKSLLIAAQLAEV